ncbi:MAG: hypothetical protein ACR2HM_06620, partial [Acidimicrobiales bacterium]
MRLVLREDSPHFNRLVICSKCGREVPGRAVLGPADLDQVPTSVTCNDCVKAAAAPARPGPPPGPAPDIAAIGEASAPQPAGAGPDGRGDEELRGQLDRLAARVDALQNSLDTEWARAKAESASLAKADDSLATAVAGLTERLDALAEAGDKRSESLDQRVEAARTELRNALHDGLAKVLAAVPAPAEDVDGRLRAAEAQLRKGRAEAAELIELHAALDAGLGMLRAELGEGRSALARIADSKADLEDRLETFVRTSLVPEGETGRKVKKAAESQLTMLAAAVQDWLRKQRPLGDKVASLEQS